MSQTLAGWRAYSSGDYREAFSHFGDAPTSPESIAGLALSVLALGQGTDALLLVEQSAQQFPSPEFQVLLGDLTGRTGDRSGAERILQRLIQNYPDQVLGLSLLGEQRIRQGRWDEGTQNFIDALATSDLRATLHVQRVIRDLVDAVAARRIPQEAALRFVNRIDYSVPKKVAELNRFFAAARRAINNHQRMEPVELPEPWSQNASEVAHQAEASPRAESPSPRPPDRDRPVRTAQHNLKSRASGPRPVPQETTDTTPAQKRARRTRRPQRPEPIIAANLTDMGRVMREERHANEALQENVPTAIPPAWPSELEEPIDTIPAVEIPRGSIFGGSDSIRTQAFKLTEGDIGVEITLERCMHNMLASIQSIGDVTVPFNLQALRQLELNLLDDIFARMPSLSALYRDETAVNDQRPLAVGKFLGDCIAQAFGGVWHYKQPPEASTMSVGQQKLDPLGVATSILAAEHFDEVGFAHLIRQAEAGVGTGTAMVARHFYVDPTPGLDGEALSMKLAELWAAYRFVLPVIQINEIADSLRVLSTHPAFIVMSLSREYISENFLTQVGPGALGSDQRVALAYVRQTGEFLLLSSARHFARLLEVSGFSLTEASLATVLPWLQRLFRPGWRLVENQEVAERARARIGHPQIGAPQLHSRGIRGTALQATFLDRAASWQLTLEHQIDALTPFTLSLEELV
ncbi:hypothetical protein DL240_12835 [Lujinxingia litoralis]|uniref:Uncharacterized protein n=1 Tax=Lujinxingia litoralis TaxID=2211119 RepID=A0A328C6I3_9DELT|nr:hypothetical protein [Lujinxingia litoralis]RAL21733.1 hypothetical protein DL240_12835 [Lujinxingia litoralis]